MFITSFKYIIGLRRFTTLKDNNPHKHQQQNNNQQNHNHEHHHEHNDEESEVDSKDLIAKMPFYRSFRQGLDYQGLKNYEEANKCYQNALNLLDNKDQLFSHYGHIFKKLVANNYFLKKYKNVEDNLYALIKFKKTNKIQNALIYDDYNHLFQLFLKCNPEKAILLGKALLSKKQGQNLTVVHKKLFQFNLANAYFMIGNYSDAKAKYSQCLQAHPNDQLKIKVYNNLALACWWNKNPLINEQEVNKEQISSELVDSDFKQAKSLFLKGIFIAENPNNIIDAQQKYILTQSINEYQLNPQAKFKNPESIQLIYNLVQYYINNEPFQKMKILYWIRILLRCSENRDSQIFNEAYINFCLLNNEKKELVERIQILLKRYQNTFQEIYYTKIAIVLERMKGDKEKAKKLSEKVVDLQKKYQEQDKYIFKRKYLKTYSLQL